MGSLWVMSAKIRVVTDSNTMLPACLVDRFGVTVVPLQVVVNGESVAESSIEVPEFWEQLRRGATVTTAAPSPGDFGEAYSEAAQSGADGVLSVHIGSAYSGTLNAARVAAASSAVPVTLVDTGAASFAAGMCVWRAAEALATGASVGEASRVAGEVGAAVGSAFTIGDIERARRGGRLDAHAGSGVAVMASDGPDMVQLRTAATAAAAIEAIVKHVSRQPGGLRVGVGHADAAAAAAKLAERVGRLSNVEETIRYVVGPSVAAHTGAGTFGVVFHAL